MKQHSKFDALGELASSIGAQDFAAIFHATFTSLIASDHITVICLSGSATTHMLVSEGTLPETGGAASLLASSYLAHDELQASGVAQDDNAPFVRLRRLAPGDGLYDRHLQALGVSGSLMLVGKITDQWFFSSFYRTAGAAPFSNDDMEALETLGTFIVHVLHRHDELLSNQQVDRKTAMVETTDDNLKGQTAEYLHSVLLAEPCKLSQREAHICAGIAMGYSVLEISLLCAITPNTVITHRKRAYAKLGISTQSELFWRFLPAIRDFQGQFRTGEADPE